MNPAATARVFGLARACVGRMPDRLARGAFALAADLAWASGRGGVRQLERNLARLRPGMPRRALRRLSREGMRRYLQYYCEVFQLPALTAEQIAARVRFTGDGPVRAALAEGRSVVCALGHCGNWDLAGAYATRELAPVLTVAEVLEPEEVFRDFLDFRTGLGMTILPLKGDGVFRQLLRRTRDTTHLVPLLADRDLTATGVEVDLAGHRARVAAGPAALAVSAGAPLYAVMIRHERLHGSRRRVAGSAWGIVIEFLALAHDPSAGERDVAALTQGWVDALAAGISRHPEDWHMLQKVFLEDLDPGRLAEASARSAAAEAAGGAPAGGGP